MFELPKSYAEMLEPSTNPELVSASIIQNRIEQPIEAAEKKEIDEVESCVEMPLLAPSENDCADDQQALVVPEGQSEEHSTKPKCSWWRELLSWLLHITAAIAIALLLNTYVVGLVHIQGDSMNPSLLSGDLLIVSRFSSPKCGSVVIFPHGDVELVKRVIATEGQTVLIDYPTNAVFVDNRLLDEPYINLAVDDPMEDHGGESEWVVPEGCVFVMGDNRNWSRDSRDIGPVESGTIIGVEIVRIPIGKWRT